MPRRSALGRDPLAGVEASLDDLLPPRRRESPTPSPAAEKPAPPAPRNRRQAPPRSSRPSPPLRAAGGRARLTVDLSAAVLERARAAVYWTPGLTLAHLTADALAREVDRLEQHRGEPFPAAAGDLPPGPPPRPP